MIKLVFNLFHDSIYHQTSQPKQILQSDSDQRVTVTEQ